MATYYDYINKFEHKCNWWESADWENLHDGELKVLSHLHFEDLRRRIHILRYPWVGFKTISENYSNYWEWKWAYGGSGTTVFQNTYFEKSLNKFITLKPGEWRWGDSSKVGGYPMGSDYKYARPVRPGNVVHTFWDGDFYADNGEYIPPMLFNTNATGEPGFTNAQSVTPPLSRVDGKWITGSVYNKLPWFSRYHDYDVNSDCVVLKRLKNKEFPSNPAVEGDYYTIAIPAYRYLPQHTDPLEQDRPIHCLDEDKMIWQIRNKVKPIKETISDAAGQGPNAEGRSYMMGNITSVSGITYKIGWEPKFPPQNNIARYDGHPNAGNGGREGIYAEPKFSTSYQAAVEMDVERGEWLLPVDDDYIDNFMLYHNLQLSDGTYPYGTQYGEWNPQKYDRQYEYALISSDLFGCNGVGYEKLLKELSGSSAQYYDWWWDNQSPFTHGDVIRIKYNWQHTYGNYKDMWQQIPNAFGCWRRTWQYSTGLRKIGVRWWPGELGPPTEAMGYIDGDSRMIVEQRHYDHIVAGYPELVKYYRVGDPVAIENAYNAAYGAS